MTTLNRPISYQVSLPHIIRFGAGVLNTLSGEVEKLGAKKALIVTDPGVFKSGLVQPVKEQLSKVLVDIFSEAEPEPSLSGLNKSAQMLRKGNYDIIIGVGGGSSIDTAKGLAVLLAHGGEAEN